MQTFLISQPKLYPTHGRIFIYSAIRQVNQVIRHIN